MAGLRFAARFGRSAAAPPASRRSGLRSADAALRFRTFGPLSFVLPPSFHGRRKVQPAAGNGLARRLIAATAKLRFSRNRRRMAASPGQSGSGRRVRLMPCVAVLNCRKFFLPSLLFMMIHSFFVAATAAEASATVAARSHIHPAGEGVVTIRLRRCLRLTAPRPRHRQFLSICWHHPPRQRAETGGGSCLVIATRRLLPGEGVGLVHTRSPPHPSLRSDADLLWPLSALTLATGQVFTVTHAPGNEVPGDPAAASRCSLRSRLSLSASVSPRRLRRERGCRPVLPVCRRQPPRLRSLPVADHASLLSVTGQGMKKAAAVSLLRFTHGRSRSAADRYRHHAAVASTITSRYVEVVRCAATARASPARQGFT